MKREELIRALADHAAASAEEEASLERLRRFVAGPSDPFARSNPEGHVTGSAIVARPDGSAFLVVYHRKLGRWLQPGGHIEPADASCLAAARREVMEETGVAELLPLAVRGVPSELEEGIFDVDVHQIPANSREGAHAHFDVRYAFEARAVQLTVSDEVKAARWVELEAVAALNDEESIARPVRALLGVRVSSQ